MNEQYSELNQIYSEKHDDYYNSARKEMIAFIPAEAKSILDIGCGSGNFGQLLKRERNCTVWGIEPTFQSAQDAAEKLDKVIHTTFSPDIPELQEKTFDAICFNDVLEHLIEPNVVLRECQKFLTPNGSIVASIPNFLFFPVLEGILVGQDWKYDDNGILDYTHLRFFTKKSIVRLFEECGYEIVKIEGINFKSGRKYKVLNALLVNRLSDWKYMQFAVQAKVKSR